MIMVTGTHMTNLQVLSIRDKLMKNIWEMDTAMIIMTTGMDTVIVMIMDTDTAMIMDTDTAMINMTTGMDTVMIMDTDTAMINMIMGKDTDTATIIMIMGTGIVMIMKIQMQEWKHAPETPV